MYTETQIEYLTEVLGVSVAMLPRARNAGADVAPPEVLVLTEALNSEETALLKKILGSISLDAYLHIQCDAGAIPQLPPAKHTLAFLNGNESQGWWHLPRISEMMGNGTEVSARKREAWNKLQQFAGERGS